MNHGTYVSFMFEKVNCLVGRSSKLLIFLSQLRAVGVRMSLCFLSANQSNPEDDVIFLTITVVAT